MNICSEFLQKHFSTIVKCIQSKNNEIRKLTSRIAVQRIFPIKNKEFASELFREARICKNNYLSAPLRSCGAFLFYRKFRELSYRIKKEFAGELFFILRQRRPKTPFYTVSDVSFSAAALKSSTNSLRPLNASAIFASSDADFASLSAFTQSLTASLSITLSF